MRWVLARAFLAVCIKTKHGLILGRGTKLLVHPREYEKQSRDIL